MPHKNYKSEKALLRDADRQMDTIRAKRPTQPPEGFTMDYEEMQWDEMKRALVLAFWMTLVGLVCIVIVFAAISVIA